MFFEILQGIFVCWLGVSCLVLLVLQGIWLASIFVALPVLIRTHKAIRASHAEILSGSAATGAVFAELFMIKSLLVFNPKARPTSDESSSPRWNTSMVCKYIIVAFSAQEHQALLSPVLTAPHAEYGNISRWQRLYDGSHWLIPCMGNEGCCL